MGIDNASSGFTQEQINKYGREMIAKYGLEPCKGASKLDKLNMADGSLSTYKTQVRQILHHADNENPDPTNVIEIIEESDKSPSTKNIMVVSFRKYYDAIGEKAKSEELNQLSDERSVSQEIFSGDMEVKEWITEDEFEKVDEHLFPDQGESINKLQGSGKAFVLSLEHKALALTLYYTGCRVGEICKRNSSDFALEFEDVYNDEGMIKVYRLKKSGKGIKRQMRVVPDRLLDILNEYSEWKSKSTGPIFDFTTKTAQNRMKDIDQCYKFWFGEWQHMEKLTPHKLRHGRVTAIANHSGIEKAGEFVDHSSTDVTKAYRHISTKDQREMLPENSKDEQDELVQALKQMDDDELEEIVEAAKSD